jgi:hypothetical protein
MLASLRKREEEVKQQMAGHLRERDKERENHQHLEAGNYPSFITVPFGDIKSIHLFFYFFLF